MPSVGNRADRETDTVTDSDNQYPPERQNAHIVAERVARFFERIDCDRAKRRNNPAPISGQGVSPVVR